MLNLTDLETWQRLDYVEDYRASLPEMLSTLRENEDILLLNTIFSECIYEQGYVYQASLATIPHIIDICRWTENNEFLWAAYINIGSILAEFDEENAMLSDLLKSMDLDANTVTKIEKDFFEAIEIARTELTRKLLNNYPYKTEHANKIHFLGTLAALNGIYNLANVLILFSANNEYYGTCEACQTELFFWNDENKLKLYTQDPVFNKEQKSYTVRPCKQKVKPNKLISKENNIDWLSYYTEKVKLDEFTLFIPYLLGSYTCPDCQTEGTIIESLI